MSEFLDYEGLQRYDELIKTATVNIVTNAINALDGGTIGTPGAGKTITALSLTNGNISATFGNISITKSLVSDFPTIPIVNNAKFSVKGAGTEVASTTANASTASSVDIVAGNNVTVTADATNNKITIASTDTNTWRPIGTGSTDAAAGNHTHDISITADSGTNALTMAANTKYKITAGGKSFIFTTPPDSNTTYSLAGLMGSSAKGSTTQPIYWTGSAFANTSYTLGASVPSNAVFTDHTYNFSGTAFTSNNNNGVDTNNVTYNAHTYYTSNGPTKSLGASTDDGALYSQAYSTSWVAQIALDYRNGNLFTRGKNNGTWLSWRKVMYTGDALTKAQVTNALGYTPPTSDTNTTYKLNINGTELGGGTTSLGTVYAPTTAGTSGLILTSSGSGAPTWSTASKPNYEYGEINYSSNSANASGTVTVNGSVPLHILTATSNISSISFTTGVPIDRHSCHIVIIAASNYTVTLAHDSTVTISSTTYTFKCPEAEDVSLDIKAGGFVELDLLRIGTNIYVRGI